MSLDTCTPTPHSYMHVSDNSIYALSADAAPFVSQMCSSWLEEDEPSMADPCYPPYVTTVFHVSFTGIIFSEFNEFPENR